MNPLFELNFSKGLEEGDDSSLPVTNAIYARGRQITTVAGLMLQVGYSAAEVKQVTSGAFQELQAGKFSSNQTRLRQFQERIRLESPEQRLARELKKHAFDGAASVAIHEIGKQFGKQFSGVISTVLEFAHALHASDESGKKALLNAALTLLEGYGGLGIKAAGDLGDYAIAKMPLLSFEDWQRKFLKSEPMNRMDIATSMSYQSYALGQVIPLLATTLRDALVSAERLVIDYDKTWAAIESRINSISKDFERREMDLKSRGYEIGLKIDLHEGVIYFVQEFAKSKPEHKERLNSFAEFLKEKSEARKREEEKS